MAISACETDVGVPDAIEKAQEIDVALQQGNKCFVDFECDEPNGYDPDGFQDPFIIRCGKDVFEIRDGFHDNLHLVALQHTRRTPGKNGRTQIENISDVTVKLIGEGEDARVLKIREKEEKISCKITSGGGSQEEYVSCEGGSISMQRFQELGKQLLAEVHILMNKVRKLAQPVYCLPTPPPQDHTISKAERDDPKYLR